MGLALACRSNHYARHVNVRTRPVRVIDGRSRNASEDNLRDGGRRHRRSGYPPSVVRMRTKEVSM